MTEINITPFDNEISISHKWARHFNIPIKLIITRSVIKTDKEETIYSNSFTEIQKLVQEGYNLEQIYEELSNDLETEDIAMIYTFLNPNKPDILEEVNQLYETKELEKIQDLNELNLVLADWGRNINKDLASDLENLENLDIIQTELAKYPEVLYSPIKVDQVTIKTFPTLNGTIPTTDDGVIMFNLGKVSYNVPYIKYNGSSSKRLELLKLYRGRTDEEMPNYKMILPASSQTNKDDSLYFTVWSGKKTLTKATKESYLKGSYSISKNLLSIKTPTEEDTNQETVIQKIEKALPIKINNYTETGISGEFFMFDLDINDIYLVDMVINTELMNSYLFVKETNTPYANKKQLKIYYKSFKGFVEEEEKVSEGYIVNPSSVTISITQNKAVGGEIVTAVINDVPTKFRLTHGLPYIRAKITQAESLEVANQFVKIFSRLMQYYKAEKSKVERLFSAFIPELSQPVIGTDIKITVKQATGKKGAGDSKIERLKEVAPDLFVNGYARKCQCVFQPISVPPDEIEAWQNNTFLYKDVLRKRQIMAFPPDNPKWNFVCPNDSTPFPGVKMNKDLENKDIYPCVPCCFKDDQMDPQANSNYNECFKGKIKKVEPVTGATKETHKIKTDKILDPGRYGYLPKNITNLLTKYSENAADVVRMGVIRSANSLLHCVSMALQDPNYLASPDKELYVSHIRKVIVGQTLPNLLKQEMYDFTDEDIIDQMSNNQNFFDPNLFYRAVENTYNINMYVFAPPSKDEQESVGTFAIPRFKLFHSRSPRPEKRTVLIFRTSGSESDSLGYPQCELIVDRDENNNKNITNFGNDMNDLLHNALVKLNRTITWELFKSENRIIARENIYSRENYYYLLNRLPTKQIIDGYGKVQAFILSIMGKEMTVIIPSTQPENLPTGEVTRVDSELVIGMFGEPRAVTKAGNLVDGLWYQLLDLEYGLYVPIVPTEKYLDLNIGPSNPLVEEGSDVVQRLRKLKRDLDAIIQIVIWLFLLSKLDVPNFANKYMSIGKLTGADSKNIYDLSKVGLKFPVVNSVEEGITAMKILAPTLFHQDRIFLYNQKFFDGIIYHLEQYNKERKPKNMKIPTVIHYTDITEEDFDHSGRVAIFIGEASMRTWLSSLDKLSFKNIIIENELSISNALRTEPYLYNAPTGNIYMIQNVIGGDRLRALNVAYNWYVNKTNLGHTGKEFEDPQNVPVFVVYGISPALAPVIIENHAGESNQYLQLLSYGSGQFGAMLPLL